MTTHTFTIRDVLSKGWAKTKEHAWFLLLTIILFLVVMSIFNHIPILGYVINTFVTLAFSSVVLAIIHDKKPKFHDITKYFATYHKPLRMLVISILVYCATVIGLVLLVVPGIYIAVRFMFYPYYILEHEHKTIEQSLREIFAITKGHAWKLFLFCITVGILNLLGLLALGVGFLVTLPVTTLAAGYIYKTLTPHYKR
jgi:uncharacterized membrane protein